MGKGFPVTVLIGNPSLYKHLIDQDDPWIVSSLKLLSDLPKQFNLKKTLEILKWFAHDPQFTPSQHDHKFKEWTTLGITTRYSLLSKGMVRSFQDLKDKSGLQNLFRYLQIGDYMGKKL